MNENNNRLYEKFYNQSKVELLCKAAHNGNPCKEYVVDIEGIARYVHLNIFLSRHLNSYWGATNIRMIKTFLSDYNEYEIATNYAMTSQEEAVNDLIGQIEDYYNRGYTIIRYAKGVAFW